MIIMIFLTGLFQHLNFYNIIQGRIIYNFSLLIQSPKNRRKFSLETSVNIHIIISYNVNLQKINKILQK